MTKQLTYQGSFKINLLSDQLLDTLGWSPITQEETARVIGDDTEVTIYADDDTLDADVQAIVDAHDHEALSVGEIKEASRLDAEQRFLLSQLANRTPQEIYTAMQNKMDNWSSLADAKADLREWLPLLAAIISWKVM